MSIPKLPAVKSSNVGIVEKSKDLLLHQANSSDKLFQDGRYYKIGNIKHQLPEPSKLRPYIDIKSGHLDTWPAHANSSTSKLSARPKFLQNLETYLQAELRALGCINTSKPTDTRLQAYREVFEYLINDFHTYKPLLSSIKNEYEAMINHQKDSIKALEPLKGMLININDQCEQKVLQLKQEEKQDLVSLRNENESLQGTISTLNDEIASLQRQVEKCQQEVAIEYKKYRDESDSRKLLIQDINDLKEQQEEARKVAMHGEVDSNAVIEDPLMLRIALRKAREDLDIATLRLAETLADYGDVVPRRDHEKLENNFKGVEEEILTLKKDHEALLKEHSALIDIHKKVIEQRDSFANDCEIMRRSATPRPDWNKCGLYIEGGPERWNQLSIETSTCDKVEILLSEMTGYDLSLIKTGEAMVVEFFEPKGVTDEIPKYLQSTERVRNRRLSKRDLCILIKDVWQEKIKLEGCKLFETNHSKMADFFYQYLQQRFAVDSMVVEWGYNTQEALIRYNYDNNVAMFAAVLNEEVDEDVYYSQLSSLEELYKIFATLDPEEMGILSKSNFQEALSKYFSSMKSENIELLLLSVEEELDGFTDDMVSYRDVFTEDDEGKSGPFITQILKLMKEDREEYFNEITSYLDSYSELNADEVSNMFHAVTPNITESKCEKYIQLALRNDDVIKNKSKLPNNVILQNLKSSCICR